MNDGMPFRPQDWQRLKKIAEGNPDEEKIGAYVLGREQGADEQIRCRLLLIMECLW